MKNLSVTGVYPAWTYVGELLDEMRPAGPGFALRHPELAARKTSAALEPLLLRRFPGVDFDFCLCFRCLERASGRVSKARLTRNQYDPNSFSAANQIPQSSRTLGMDIVVDQEDLEIAVDKAAQRRVLGSAFWWFLQDTLPKYRSRIPMTEEEVGAILSVIKEWLMEYEWL